MFWIWLFFAVILLIIEALTTSFFTLWFAIGAFVAALIARLGSSFTWQLGAFVISSGVLVILSRTIFVRLLTKGKTIRSNVDSLLGKTGVVKTEVNNSDRNGEILIEGNLYKAVSKQNETLSVDSNVEVIGVDGNRLVVEQTEGR
jgi:membrane protein implicated in regulation of membrane protease activity